MEVREMNVPQLRFREFSEEWKHIPAEQLFENIVEKNCSAEKVLTIIQGTGTVLRENSGRDILFDETTTDNYKKVQKGDFIIHLRSFQAGFEIANSDGIVSPAYTILRSKKTIGTLFYRNYFRSNRFINQTLCSAVEGVRDGRQISYSQFKQIPIVSTSLSEQQKIAEFLSTIDEKINNQQNIVASLEAQKKGFMQKIFSQELRFKGENGGDFPEWEEKKLGDICEINPKTVNLPEKFIYIDLESVVAGALNVEKEIEKLTAPSRAQRVLQKKDILFQMVRPYQKNNFYFNISDDNSYVASTGYAQLRCYIYNSKYVYQYLHFQRFVDEVITRCTGTGYPAINSTDLADIHICIPSLPEQQKIANFLSAYDEKIDAEKQILTHWKTIKKAMLQQMFV